ncbi:MAG: hypothetical protein P4L11_07865 [Geothrix sp.]|nr:hypothetical protein [Geothrix sp.]
MKPFVLTCLAFLTASGLGAQTPEPPRSDHDQLQELQRKVDALSQALEQAQGAPQAAQASQAGGGEGLGVAAAKIYGVSSGVSLGGYGEFLYQNFASKLQDGTPQPQHDMFDTLRGVFYIGYRFNDWILFNSEMEFEHSGVSDEHAQGEAILEFAYLDFLIDPAFNIRAGQVLLPLGFTNEQHEPPSVLSAQRPFLEQEGGIIPTTWHENGLGIHGRFLSEQFTYRVYTVTSLNAAGFGPAGITGGRQDGHQAIADRFAVTGRLDWTPLPGGTLGVGFYHGSCAYAPTGPVSPLTVPVSLGELHAEYKGGGWQLRGLYARTTVGASNLEALGPAAQALQVGTRQWGGYLEAGYDVLKGNRQALIPFLRWERLNLQEAVAAGVTADPANDQSIVSAGFSWKPIPQIAVKATFDRIRNGAATGWNELDLGLGYEF